jgi:hypothetical protein
MSEDDKKSQDRRHEKTQEEWASSVTDHFRQTRTFRAEDIIRVLGNPLEGVEVKAMPEKCFSGKTERR